MKYYIDELEPRVTYCVPAEIAEEFCFLMWVREIAEPVSGTTVRRVSAVHSIRGFVFIDYED